MRPAGTLQSRAAQAQAPGTVDGSYRRSPVGLPIEKQPAPGGCDGGPTGACVSDRAERHGTGIAKAAQGGSPASRVVEKYVGASAHNQRRAGHGDLGLSKQEVRRLLPRVALVGELPRLP